MSVSLCMPALNKQTVKIGSIHLNECNGISDVGSQDPESFWGNSDFSPKMMKMLKMFYSLVIRQAQETALYRNTRTYFGNAGHNIVLSS